MKNLPDHETLHTVIIDWSTPISTSPLLSEKVQSQLQFLLLSRLAVAIQEYAAHIRSVVRSIVEAKNITAAVSISPMHVREDNEGMRCGFSIVLQAPESAWETLQVHIQQTLEGLHQTVCTE